MENAKKMILVEPSVIERLKTKESTPEDSLSRIDREMQKIMRSKLEDREKWTLYLQTLQRYLHFTGEERQPIKLPILEQQDIEYKDDPHKAPLVKQESIIEKNVDKFNRSAVYTNTHLMRIVPKNLKKKGELLVRTLLENNEKIRWNDSGVVFVDNKSIPNSNILDLVNDVLRQLKRPKPIGWEEFAKALKEIGTPLSCIGNPTTHEYITNLIFTELEQEKNREQENNTFVTPVKKASGSPKLKKKKLDWEKWTPY